MITFVSRVAGVNTGVGANSTTVTLPTHRAGDTMLLYAYYTAGPNAQVIGNGLTGWVQLDSNAASNDRVGLWKRVADGTETSLTVANTSVLIVAIYRGVYKVGVVQGTMSATGVTSVPVPGLTLNRTIGDSWVVGFVGSVQHTSTSVPTGMTSRQLTANLSANVLLADTNNGVTGWAATTSTLGSSSKYAAYSVELMAQPAPSVVPKRYATKVYDNTGAYLGMLPLPADEFSMTSLINSSGSQIVMRCPVNIDTASLQNSGTLQDESGADLLDESGQALLTEGAVPSIALGTGGALVKNGNRVVVTEYSYWYPAGQVIFRGKMEKWIAAIGGNDSDSVNILCYSDGTDLDNYALTGSPFTYTIDQSNTSSNTTGSVYATYTNIPAFWNRYGQTFVVGGSGLTNVGAISLLMTGTATATVRLWSNSGVTTLLASSTQDVNVTSPTEVRFTFPAHYYVTAGTTLFFSVEVPVGQTIDIAIQNTSTYASGTAYQQLNTSTTGTPPAYSALATNDLWFKTWVTTGSTSASFTSQDPTTGMLASFMTDYMNRGGLISYASTTVDATGLTLSYTMISNSILDGINAILGLSPNGFYWYLDMGNNLLYFKNASTSPDLYLTKGLHIDDFELSATIENVVNDVLFTGGADPGNPGFNILKEYTDPTSISLYGPRLKRQSDNRVTLSATADAIGTSALATYKNEQFDTVVTITDDLINTQALHPGQIVGFRGFGTFIDTLKLQIVRKDYTPTQTTLTLGTVPQQMSLHTEQLTRELLALQTIDNPTTPS